MRPLKRSLSTRLALCFLVVASALAAEARGADGRRLTLDDLAREQTVKDPRISPDGEVVAYTVRSRDFEEDRQNDDLWLARWDGGPAAQLTFRKEKDRTPRWSPDGRRLAFRSNRDDDIGNNQLWILSREGGEAQRLTDLKGDITDFAWSPDGRRIVFAMEDPEPDAGAAADKGGKTRTPKPIVTDRFQFKEDESEYLHQSRQHLYLLDVEKRTSEILTPGAYNEYLPAWSPDGSSIVFVTKRGEDFDRHNNWDLYLIAARPGASARRLTTFEGADADPDLGHRPAWSPDGKQIAYVRGGEPRLMWYSVQTLAVVPVSGGEPRLPVKDADLNVGQPLWSADGKWIYFLLEPSRRMEVARVPAAGGAAETVTDGKHRVSAFSLSRDGRLVVLRATAQEPAELFAVEDAALRPLSRHNAWLQDVKLGAVEEIDFTSKDGTGVHGFLVKPAGYKPRRKYPAVLRIHGGPVWQYYHEFHFDWQLLAANGFAVVAANPRGSTGRGEEFQAAIFADWGNKDAQDVLAAVDHAVKLGIADPDRLGIGGWSYGGMLTNYTIAQDTRFKAATSGAGISNILAGYGTDQYIREYEIELGRPWENLDAWLHVSFPFLHADRIVTPTLFVCGERDFNVPLLNSEQMYQALRSLGIDTQLVIYPGEYHSIDTPSYERDRLERYLAWYDRYLKP